MRGRELGREREGWGAWGGEEFATSTNRPTSDFAKRISFRFLASGWLHGTLNRKGGNMLQSRYSGIQSCCNHNHSKVCALCFLWPDFVVFNLFRSKGSTT